MQTVFDWLDEVRARPAMLVREKSLHHLESLIWGYYTALRIHAVPPEPVPSIARHFLYWIAHRTGWSCCRGWAEAIVRRHPDPMDALATFFRFVDEYRQLKPVRLCGVRLTAEHNPTGRRVCYGLDGRMPRPCRVEVIRYRPGPFHFLRLHYPDRIEDHDLLMTSGGKYATTVRDAKRWVRDELQVPFATWKSVAATTRHRAHAASRS